MSPAVFLDSNSHSHHHPNGQLSPPFNFSVLYSNNNLKNQSNNIMTSSNNSNHFTSSDSNFGFNSPPLASGKPAGAPPPSSRPRLLKVRKQSASHHPRSSNTFTFGGSGTGTRVADLGSNPFQPSSYAATSTSILGNTNATNVGSSTTFLFGVNSNSASQMGSSTGVVDELRKLNIGSGDVNSAALFNSKGLRGGGNRNGVEMDESVVAELPNEIKKLNIDGKTENVSSSFGASGVDPNAANRFNHASRSSEIAMELPNEMKKMNLDDARDVNRETNVRNADNSKSFVFGSSSNFNDSLSGNLEIALPIKMMNLNMKDSSSKIEKSSFASGSSRSTAVNVGGKAENLISDELRKLKVGIGAGDASDQLQMGQPSNETPFHNFSKTKHSDPQQAGAQDKNLSGLHIPPDCEYGETKLHDTTSSSMSASFSSNNYQPVWNDFYASSMNRPEKVEFAFTSRLDSMGTPHVEFKTPNMKGNLFSGASSKLEAKKGYAKYSKLKKKKGKLRKPTADPMKLGQEFVSRESSQENPESFEAYSPMDASPYQETLADNTYSRETSVASDDASHIGDNYVSSESRPAVTIDEDLITATHCLDINEGHVMYSEKREEVSENNFNKGIGTEGFSEDSVSGAETESFKSATEHLDYSSDTFVTAVDAELSSTASTERKDSDVTSHFTVSSNAEDIGRGNFAFAASSAQGQSSTETRHHKKKHRPKIGHDSFSPTPNTKISYASPSVEFFPLSGSSTFPSPRQGKKGDVSSSLSRNGDKSEPVKEQGKEKIIPNSTGSTTAQEACEKWRLRGNQAYDTGDLSKAEDYYTQGLNSVSQSETSRSCLRALMLCYSNRAATRMSLGRMREALKDCLMAAGLDPNFLKVQVRAANCYLALGEVEDALLHYMKCLQSGSDVCADRKVLVEASEGLEKAQKVSDNILQSTELLRRKTPEDIELALKFIDEALGISSSSEQLLEMKADALLMLRKYEQVIHLCEQTLASAEMNSPTYEGENNSSSGDGSTLPRSSFSKLWRLSLIVKSYFYLGRLEEALDFVKKQEDSDPLMGSARRGSMREESVIPLADTVRELLSRKAAGNEAFQSGKHAEAVEHYTAALSCNVESRPFTAICFCNRAAAYRALGQITDAIADCSLAIALDGNYLKAISRRAGLFEMIRDYGQAATDYQRLVTLLTKQVEEKVNRSGASDKLSYLNELRQNQQRLSIVEEEDRKEIPLNMYLIMGVEPSAAASEIKKAYRKAALKHHPDKAGQSLARSENGDDGIWREIAEEVHKDTDRLFKMIAEAYAVLSNPTKRSQYDQEEEMRKEATRFARSGASRMYGDAQNYPFERSGNRRQWQEVWRQYSNSQSRGPERTRTSR